MRQSVNMLIKVQKYEFNYNGSLSSVSCMLFKNTFYFFTD